VEICFHILNIFTVTLISLKKVLLTHTFKYKNVFHKKIDIVLFFFVWKNVLIFPVNQVAKENKYSNISCI